MLRPTTPVTHKQVMTLFPELACAQANAEAVTRQFQGAFNNRGNIPPRVRQYMQQPGHEDACPELWMLPENADLVNALRVYGNGCLLNNTGVNPLCPMFGSQAARVTPMDGVLSAGEREKRLEAEIMRKGGCRALFPVFIDDYLVFDVPQTEAEEDIKVLAQIVHYTSKDTGADSSKDTSKDTSEDTSAGAGKTPWAPIAFRYEVVWRGGLVTPLPASLIHVTRYPEMDPDPSHAPDAKAADQ
jgi:hypothetical protein